MAIRRCPYCKAIIDESQKYCNNCGTQLLFPQDEEIEEDIKGEKIRDDDFRDAGSDEAGFEKSLGPSEKAVREEIDLEKILEGSASFPDDLVGGENDDIEPTPDEPIIKPLPKPRAVPKLKIPQKSGPKPQPPEKAGTAPKTEFKAAPMPASRPTPLREPAREPELPPVVAVEEKPAPPIPAAVAAEPRVESRVRPEPPAAKMDEDEEPGPADATDGIADKQREPETGDEAREEIEGVEDDEEAEEIDEAEEELEEDEDEEKDEADGEDESEDILGPEARDEEEIATGDLDDKEIILPKKKAPTMALSPVKPVDDFEDDAGEEGRDEAEDAESAGPGASSDTAEARDESETREEIARLIAALEKKHKKIPLSRQEKKIIAPLEETNGLPAWAESSRMGGSPETDGEDDGAVKDTGGSFVPGDTVDFEEEVMKDAGRKATRPTIGIPETLSKIEIPVRDEADEDEIETAGSGSGGADSGGAEQAAPDEEAGAGFVPDSVSRRRLGFFGLLRAGICDLFFVALLWFAAAWLAAGILAVPVKNLIIQAAVPLGLLYGTLLLLYLFLFLFFLGETLGGRLAAPRR